MAINPIHFADWNTDKSYDEKVKYQKCDLESSQLN